MTWSHRNVVQFFFIANISSQMIYFSTFLLIQKVLTKLNKERGFEIIGRWQRVCVKLFYWAVTSTQEMLGGVKLAKFQALLYHVIN